MLTQINPILGFVEAVKRLSEYPELTSSDTASYSFGNFDYTYRNPIHSNKYDSRLFDSFSNLLRILIILDEPISLKNIHKELVKTFPPEEYKKLDKINSTIQNYLGRNINSVTQFSFELPGSILDTTSVRKLLNDYFAATIQHSKADAQAKIDEINVLTYGALTEMIRIIMKELKELLEGYVKIFEELRLPKIDKL